MNVPHRFTAPLLALSLLAATTAEAKRPDSLPTAHSHPTTLHTSATAADPCGYGQSRQVFLQWNDVRRYVLAQNGGLEQGDAGWTLADGAAVVEGNEPFFLNDAADHQSLALPAGSTATGPTTCIASGQPIFRFVARTSGDHQSRLKVEILYTGKKGRHRSATVGKLRAGDAWAPTKRLATRLGHAKTHGRLKTGTIAFRFTPIGPGDWQVDDLHLDPRSRR